MSRLSWGMSFDRHGREHNDRRERSVNTQNAMRRRRSRVEEPVPDALREVVACEQCGDEAALAQMLLIETGTQCIPCEREGAADITHQRGVRSAIVSAQGLVWTTGVPALFLLASTDLLAWSFVWPLVFLAHVLVAWAAGRHQARTLRRADHLTRAQALRLSSLSCYALAMAPLVLLAWRISSG